jgi:hypothetical protein
VFVEYPTAVHAFAEAHETANSVVVVPLVGLGVGWIVQWRPSHRSANVVSDPRPETNDEPTATQSLADVHDTAASALFGASDGLGVGATRQVRPFQTSANVPPEVVPGTVEYAPTAMQYTFDVHATEES